MKGSRRIAAIATACIAVVSVLILDTPTKVVAQTAPSFNILLGRPTDDSVTANIIVDQDVEMYVEHGASSGVYTTQTGTFAATADVPVEFVLDDLATDAENFYRIVWRLTGTTEWSHGAEHSVRTQRSPGSTFTFTIVSDSHLGQYGGQTARELSLYEQTLLNVDADHPDFHIDLGDTFAMDPQPLGTGMTEAEADAAYLVQRPYLAEIGDTSPIFLAIGNHENEEGWNFDDVFPAPDRSLAVVGLQARKKYFPTPVPDDFYTGNSDPLAEPIGGDTLQEDYYAWEWGDALFVVLDPFHYSMTWPSEGGTYGGEGQDGEVGGDRWDWTLGIEQYLWLEDVLESSDAAHKFVFAHHVTGGATVYGRGGIAAAPYFEWGGQNADGTWGWDTERPASEGWDVPVHQLMADNGVDAFFHGHDHIYAYEQLDGVVYLEAPKPDDAGYDWQPYGYGYTENVYPDGYMLKNSGHMRVTVSPTEVTLEYVRSYLPGDGPNGEVAHTVTISTAGPNASPVAANDPASVAEGHAVTIDVLANDTDADDDSLIVSGVTQGANGAVANNGTDVTYTHNGSSTTSDTFTYTVSDGNGGMDMATVNVEVTPALDETPPSDFDGDGLSDIAVFRPSTGEWWRFGESPIVWGDGSSILVPGDYDGDGSTDIAYYDPSTGTWNIRGQGSVIWGIPGDIAVPGDYDGDGSTDIAVYRPTSGHWFVMGQSPTVWGVTGDIPVPGDYDGDGSTDIAMYRPGSGQWFVLGGVTAHWGIPGDIPVPGDYDGNGTIDIAAFRPSNGQWWVMGSGSVVWGLPTDIPTTTPLATLNGLIED